jgi:rare lipoprotein A
VLVPLLILANSQLSAGAAKAPVTDVIALDRTALVVPARASRSELREDASSPTVAREYLDMTFTGDTAAPPSPTTKPKPTTTTTRPKPKPTTTTTRPKPTTTTRPPNQQTGEASYYNAASSGTCAHRTLPMGTVVTVTNLANGRQVRCTVSDRGPFIDGRIIDLARAQFDALAPMASGVIEVRLTW